MLESKSESAGKQGFVNYFVSYSLIFFSKKPKKFKCLYQNRSADLADVLFLECCFHVHGDTKFFEYGNTLKSDISSSQIGEGAYSTQIFGRETLKMLCLLNHVGNKTIVLLIWSKKPDKFNNCWVKLEKDFVFLLIYCMETLKIESVESNLKRELVSYLFSEEKHINLKI